MLRLLFLQSSLNVNAVKINTAEFKPEKYLNDGRISSEKPKRIIGSIIKKIINKYSFLYLVFLFKKKNGVTNISNIKFFSLKVIIDILFIKSPMPSCHRY